MSTWYKPATDMNIIINEDEHIFLQSITVNRFLIGSHLYGTTHADSDTDYLCIYATSDEELYSGLPTHHQFQYKDLAGNTDWNYCSELQFRKNLYSGESVIHADIVLFTGYSDKKLELCRTYKVIKAYLGFARRDLKESAKGNEKKLWHAARGLYCAAELLEGWLPDLTGIKNLYTQQHDKKELAAKEEQLRAVANKQYEQGDLLNYYIEPASYPLWQKLMESNNNKEFRY